MKKLLLLCVIALTVISCPSDDDSSPAGENPIVGTWKFFKAFENGVEETLDLCETEETLIYSANGDFSAELYDDFNTTGTCELEETVTGTWSNTGNLYSITAEGETNAEEVTFEGNTFFIEFTETSSDTDPTPVTYKEVYIKQ